MPWKLLRTGSPLGSPPLPGFYDPTYLDRRCIGDLFGVNFTPPPDRAETKSTGLRLRPMATGNEPGLAPSLKGDGCLASSTVEPL